MSRRPTFIVLIASLLLTLIAAPPAALAAVVVPPMFSEARVAAIGSAANPVFPTALAFTPDGRLLVPVQTGQLRVVQNDTLLPNPALDLSAIVCNNNERGLLGVVADPNFAANHAIYLYYTFNKFGVCPGPYKASDPHNPVNRVSRFTLSDSNTVALTS